MVLSAIDECDEHNESDGTGLDGDDDSESSISDVQTKAKLGKFITSMKETYDNSGDDDFGNDSVMNLSDDVLRGSGGDSLDEEIELATQQKKGGKKQMAKKRKEVHHDPKTCCQ